MEIPAPGDQNRENNTTNGKPNHAFTLSVKQRNEREMKLVKRIRHPDVARHLK